MFRKTCGIPWRSLHFAETTPSIRVIEALGAGPLSSGPFLTETGEGGFNAGQPGTSILNPGESLTLQQGFPTALIVISTPFQNSFHIS